MAGCKQCRGRKHWPCAACGCCAHCGTVDTFGACPSCKKVSGHNERPRPVSLDEAVYEIEYSKSKKKTMTEDVGLIKGFIESPDSLSVASQVDKSDDVRIFARASNKASKANPNPPKERNLPRKIPPTQSSWSFVLKSGAVHDGAATTGIKGMGDGVKQKLSTALSRTSPGASFGGQVFGDSSLSDATPLLPLGTKPKPASLGVATWNVNHNKNFDMKASSICALFKANPWLDVLVLQEINGDAKMLRELSRQGLCVYAGPQMCALSWSDPKSGSESEGAVSLKQREYYPVVFRSGVKVSPKVRVVVDGKFVDFENKLQLEAVMVAWSKSLSIRDSARFSQSKKAAILEMEEVLPGFRPVVVYRLMVDEVVVNLAVVHTTPLGGGLGRKGEFEQVNGFFEKISKDSGLWIVAGDYYLEPEASVVTNSDGVRLPETLFRTKLSNWGLNGVVPVYATNQSRLPHSTVMERLETEEKRCLEHLAYWVGKGTLPTQLPGSALEDAWRLRGVEPKKSLVLHKRADFFVCSRDFVRVDVGLFSPRGEPIRTDPNHHAVVKWSAVSDHVPVVGVFSTTFGSSRVDKFARACEEVSGSRFSEVLMCVQEFQRESCKLLRHCLGELQSAECDDLFRGSAAQFVSRARVCVEEVSGRTGGAYASAAECRIKSPFPFTEAELDGFDMAIGHAQGSDNPLNVKWSSLMKAATVSLRRMFVDPCDFEYVPEDDDYGDIKWEEEVARREGVAKQEKDEAVRKRQDASEVKPKGKLRKGGW
jgi:hypothetical protein